MISHTSTSNFYGFVTFVVEGKECRQEGSEYKYAVWSFKLGFWCTEQLACSKVRYLLQDLQLKPEVCIEIIVENTLYRKTASGSYLCTCNQHIQLSMDERDILRMQKNFKNCPVREIFQFPLQESLNSKRKPQILTCNTFFVNSCQCFINRLHEMQQHSGKPVVPQ